MTFLLDHDIPIEIARVLRQAGHEVNRVAEVLDPRADDGKIFSLAVERGWILMTCNRRDFQTLAQRQPAHSGLIFLVRRRTRHAECAKVLSLLRQAGATGLLNNINFA